MEKIFDKDSLLQASIFELRDIARSIGVASPTVLKKEELIDKIYKIISGEEKPYVPKSRQGRPPKALTGKNKIFDALLPTTEASEEKQFEIEGDSIGILNEEIIAFLEDKSNPVLNTERFVGYLDILSTGYGLLRNVGNIYKSEKVVYVSDVQIANYNLKTGDLLDVEARLLHKDKPLVLTKIKMINGREFRNPIRNADFEKLPIEMPVRGVLFCDEGKNIVNGFGLLPMICGSRNLILIDKSKHFEKEKLIRGLNGGKSARFVYLGVELMPEIVPFIDNIKGCESFYCMLGQSCVQQSAVVNMALERAKRLVEEKNDVVLLVDSIDKIVKNENLQNGNSLDDVKKETFGLIKNLLAQPRSVSTGGSLTLVSFLSYKPTNAFDSTLIDEIETMFSKIITY